MNERLQHITEVFLSDHSGYGDLYDAAHQLHDLFAGVTGIAAGDITDQAIHLPSGKAVSPTVAAHCLLEYARTAKFLRGIYKAVRQLQNTFKDQRVNILYAGCGPYGTLLTPLTTVFRPDEIGIVLMDINPDALAYITRLYENLDLNDYIIKTLCADAAVYQIDTAVHIHLAVSETMQRALRREPQVAVMLNLIPQLQAGALFVPEKITINAMLTSDSEEKQSFLEADRKPLRHWLGEVYTIGRASAQEHRETILELPPDMDKFSDLFLFTHITVFNNEVLDTYDCSLNLPEKVCNPKTVSGKRISFKYNRTDKPKFVHEVWQ